MSKNAIQKAAEAAGGQSALARLIGRKPQTVQKMCARGITPAHHVLTIEAATGVSRQELRPDLYPAEEHGDSAVLQQQAHAAAVGGN